MSVEATNASKFEEDLYSLLTLRDVPMTVSALHTHYSDKDERQILRALMRLRKRGRVLLKRHVLYPKREPEFIAVTKALMDRHTIKTGF